MAVEDQVAVVYAATSGFLDRIDAGRVGEFHQGLVERLHAEIAEVLKKIAEGEWSDEVQKALDDAIAQYAEDFGYDLDEEGQPLSDEQASREGRGDRDEDDGLDEGGGDDGDDDGGDDDGAPSGETEEREPATA